MHLVDSYTFRPAEELTVDLELVNAQRLEAAKRSKDYGRNHFHTEEDELTVELINFGYKVYNRSGLSPVGTFLPTAINPHHTLTRPSDTGHAAAMDECRTVLTGAMGGLLRQTGLAPRDIDILVTTCSIFCPTPSMASMLINHFKLRQDVQSYHLGGMGCSNGVLSVGLIKDLLEIELYLANNHPCCNCTRQARPNCNAVLVTTEVVTPCAYAGQDKHRQVTNIIFRMGAAAVLFSNCPAMVARAKYKLVRNCRVHLAAIDESYRAIHYGPDEQGIKGIYLSKDVVVAASRGLGIAMWKMGPHILRWWQLAEFAVNAVQRKLMGKASAPLYKPDFTKACDHFLIHAGGSKVLDGIGAELRLGEQHLEPSRAVLHDYGNVSSSTTWYTLGYVESLLGVKSGETLLQIGVGSGIKCGVNVWRATRTFRTIHDSWAHRVPEQEREALKAGLHTNGHMTARRIITRVLFIASMVAVAACLYRIQV